MDDFKYQCHLCPKRFKRAFSLRNHLNTHFNRKPFVCNRCEKRFTRNHDRKAHEKIHTAGREYICRGAFEFIDRVVDWGCGRCFNRSSNLLRHFRSETGRRCIGPFLDAGFGYDNFLSIVKVGLNSNAQVPASHANPDSPIQVSFRSTSHISSPILGPEENLGHQQTSIPGSPINIEGLSQVLSPDFLNCSSPVPDTDNNVETLTQRGDLSMGDKVNLLEQILRDKGFDPQVEIRARLREKTMQQSEFSLRPESTSNKTLPEDSSAFLNTINETSRPSGEDSTPRRREILDSPTTSLSSSSLSHPNGSQSSDSGRFSENPLPLGQSTYDHSPRSRSVEEQVKDLEIHLRYFKETNVPRLGPSFFDRILGLPGTYSCCICLKTLDGVRKFSTHNVREHRKEWQQSVLQDRLLIETPKLRVLEYLVCPKSKCDQKFDNVEDFLFHFVAEHPEEWKVGIDEDYLFVCSCLPGQMNIVSCYMPVRSLVLLGLGGIKLRALSAAVLS